MKTISNNEGILHNANVTFNIDFSFFQFLANEYSYSKIKRFSKLEAFNDLIQRFIAARKSNKKLVLLTTSNLAEEWNWSRPTVSKFIKDLKRFEIITNGSYPSPYVFSLVDDKINWKNGSDDVLSSPQSASPHLSSSSSTSSFNESEDDSSNGKMFHEK